MIEVARHLLSSILSGVPLPRCLHTHGTGRRQDRRETDEQAAFRISVENRLSPEAAHLLASPLLRVQAGLSRGQKGTSEGGQFVFHVPARKRPGVLLPARPKLELKRFLRRGGRKLPDLRGKGSKGRKWGVSKGRNNREKK